MNIRQEIRGITRIEGEEKTLLRLMNICGHKDIYTWTDSKSDKYIYIYSDERKKVEDIIQKCLLDVKMMEKESLRRKIYNNKKRWSVIIGIVIFLTFIYIESLYIWHIEIEGCEDYTTDEVLNIIEQNYPCLGQKKKNICTDDLENILGDNMKDITWVSCNISGTKLTVKLSEFVDIFTSETPDKPCNLVASRDCRIYSMVTSTGTPVVKAGDEVKKGDQLISGTVNICNDDSEVVETIYVAAQGEIIGQCRINYHDDISAVHYEKEFAESRIQSVSVRFGSNLINIYKSDKALEKSQKDNWAGDINQQEYCLHLGDLYLPFSIKIAQVNKYRVHNETYTPQEMRDLAEQHIATYIGKIYKKGVQIVQKNVIITDGLEKTTAEGSITVRMPVAVPEVIDQQKKPSASQGP